MATTDTRPGFRLPWSSDRADGDQTGPESPENSIETAPDADALAPEGTAEGSTAEVVQTDFPDAPEMTADTAETPDIAVEPSAVEAPAPVAVVPAPVRKPNKFLADLTKAMQATAEAARIESLERFTADAKAATEKVHATAADEITELRRAADEDIAGIRDWSKAEIARIREVTENRISSRKSELETELQGHAGVVERRIEQVTARVAAFETEMAAFYERLSTEEDPTRFAAMAEQLPEAPSLEPSVLDADLPVARVSAIEPEPVPATASESSAPTPVADDAPVVTDVVADDVTSAYEPGTTSEGAADAPATAGVTDFAAAEAGSAAAPDFAAAEAEALMATHDEDPRVTALGLTPDFAAAEAEASLAAESSTEDASDEIPTIADEVLAARLAGLVPDEATGSNPLVTTKVIVTGLVSVASIAGFKRHLARLQGVTTVGVSSGPEGEFIFSVHHLPVADLPAGISELPGFEARVTELTDGQITVSARDPEAHD